MESHHTRIKETSFLLKLGGIYVRYNCIFLVRNSWLEELSVKSFLRFGYEYHLYSYEDLTIPAGAVLKDANEIIPKNILTTLSNDYKPDAKTWGVTQRFSNIFRYELLYKKGGWWCDTDIICLKPFNQLQPIVDDGLYAFGYQRREIDHRAAIGTGVIYSKFAHSTLFENLCFEVRKLITDTSEYDIAGPILLTKTIMANKEFKKFIYPRVFFNPFDWMDNLKLLFLDTAIPKESYTIHLWNKILIELNLKYSIPNNSLLEKLKIICT